MRLGTEDWGLGTGTKAKVQTVPTQISLVLVFHYIFSIPDQYCVYDIMFVYPIRIFELILTSIATCLCKFMQILMKH